MVLHAPPPISIGCPFAPGKSRSRAPKDQVHDYWRSLAAPGGERRRIAETGVGQSRERLPQIFSHSVPASRRSVPSGRTWLRPGVRFRSSRSRHSLQSMEVCPPEIRLRRWFSHRKGGGTEMPVCAFYGTARHERGQSGQANRTIRTRSDSSCRDGTQSRSALGHQP